MTISYLHVKILNRAELPTATALTTWQQTDCGGPVHMQDPRGAEGDGQGGGQSRGRLGWTPFPLQAGVSRAGNESCPYPPPRALSHPCPSPPPSPCGHLCSVLMSCPSGIPLSCGEIGRNKQSLHHDIAHSQTTCPVGYVCPFLRSRLPGQGSGEDRRHSLRSAWSNHGGSEGSPFTEGALGTERTALPSVVPTFPVLSSMASTEEGGMDT